MVVVPYWSYMNGGGCHGNGVLGALSCEDAEMSTR